jgi:hypothetical protein
MERQIEEMIPMPFIEHFCIGTRANSLNLVFPELLPFEEQGRMNFLGDQTFPTLETLMEALSTLPTDMEKLFRKYDWGCVSVSCGAGQGRSTVESVFHYKKQNVPGMPRATSE